MTDPKVSFTNIGRRFGRTCAVRDFDLDVPSGITLGLLGMNGAGKSTLLRMLMGLLKPHSGSVTVDGKDVVSHGPELRTRIGYVPERPTAYRWMRVGEVMRFCQSLQPNWHDPTATEMLATFRLDPDKRVGALSKGMATKLHLLLALAHRPNLLILDEPLSGLDPIVRDEFLEGTLAEICTRECTVILSSHQVDDVQRVSDRVAIMHEGSLVLEGETEAMLGSARRVKLVLSDHNVLIPTPSGLIRQQRERRTHTMTVSPCAPNLITDLESTEGVVAVESTPVSLTEFFKEIVLGVEVKKPPRI